MKQWIGIGISLLLIVTLTACNSTAATGENTASTTTARTTTVLPHEGWIMADSLRVRGGAGLSYEIVGGLKAGDRVEIIGKNGDWYEIRFGEEIGYVSGQYLTFTEPTN